MELTDKQLADGFVEMVKETIAWMTVYSDCVLRPSVPK
jgi:hypothetical protein